MESNDINDVINEALYFDKDGRIYTQDDLDFEVERFTLGMSSHGVPPKELYDEKDIIEVLNLVEIDHLELLHEEGYFLPYSQIWEEYKNGKLENDPNYTCFDSIDEYIFSLTWHHAACLWIDTKTEIKSGWYLIECHNDSEKFSVITNGDGQSFYL